MFYTSDYVLDETITLLFRQAIFEEAQHFLNGILLSKQEEFLNVKRIILERFRRSLDLRLAYRDKPAISFTDFTSMALMKEFHIGTILTKDIHFLQVGMEFNIIP